MKVKDYLGDLIGGALMIADSRTIAEVLLKQLSEDDWKKLIIEENILQKKSSHSAIRNARTIRVRLQPMGEKFIVDLLQSSERVYIQLLMVAYLVNSPIVVDFMQQSLADARRAYKTSISMDAWQDFMNDRIRAIPDLANYSDSSLKKMGSNTIKTLVDSGYLNTSRKRELQAVYLLPEVKNWLIDLNREDLIPVMECTL